MRNMKASFSQGGLQDKNCPSILYNYSHWCQRRVSFAFQVYNGDLRSIHPFRSSVTADSCPEKTYVGRASVINHSTESSAFIDDRRVRNLRYCSKCKKQFER